RARGRTRVSFGRHTSYVTRSGVPPTHDGAAPALLPGARTAPCGEDGSAHVHQVDHEDQGLAAGDRRSGPAVAIGQVRGDLQAAAPADLHAHQALVPALDDLSDADPEVQRLTAVPGGIEL